MALGAFLFAPPTSSENNLSFFQFFLRLNPSFQSSILNRGVSKFHSQQPWPLLKATGRLTSLSSNHSTSPPPSER